MRTSTAALERSGVRKSIRLVTNHKSAIGQRLCYLDTNGSYWTADLGPLFGWLPIFCTRWICFRDTHCPNFQRCSAPVNCLSFLSWLPKSWIECLQVFVEQPKYFFAGYNGAISVQNDSFKWWNATQTVYYAKTQGPSQYNDVILPVYGFPL